MDLFKEEPKKNKNEFAACACIVCCTRSFKCSSFFCVRVCMCQIHPSAGGRGLQDEVCPFEVEWRLEGVWPDGDVQRSDPGSRRDQQTAAGLTELAWRRAVGRAETDLHVLHRSGTTSECARQREVHRDRTTQLAQHRRVANTSVRPLPPKSL